MSKDKNFVDEIRFTRNWIESVVVGLNLCPFASRELHNERIRMTVCHASSEDSLLVALSGEMALLDRDPSIETTLLIHPEVLRDFSHYNQFLSRVDSLVVDSHREGIYQIASFHPQYQFAETTPNDVENFSNRSPYPMLHILREASVAKAIASFPDVKKIPESNINKLNDIGREKILALLEACFDVDGNSRQH